MNLIYCGSEAGEKQVVILKEGKSQNRGRQAQSKNIMTANLISEVVNPCLGPKGMDKMRLDCIGDDTITTDANRWRMYWRNGRNGLKCRY
jgi:hypothetical protein